MIGFEGKSKLNGTGGAQEMIKVLIIWYGNR